GFMCGESGPAATKNAIGRIMADRTRHFGPGMHAICNELVHTLPVVWNFNVPKLNDPFHVQAVRRVVESKGLELLIIDPVYLSLPGINGSSHFSVGEPLEKVTQIAKDTGCAIILIHHTVKATSD